MKLVSGLVIIPVLLVLSRGVSAQTAPHVPPENRQDNSMTGQSTTVPHEMMAAAPPVSTKALTKISAGDVLEINVYGAPDLAQRARVNNAGDVYLSLIDYVHLDALTIDQAQELIARKYKDGGFLVNPHVSITIADSVSGVFVRGQVAKPGVYPILGSAGLVDVIATAGGLTADASDAVTITHHDHPDQPETITLSDDPTKNQSTNVPVYQGDTVLVLRAGIVYVIGEVQAPAGLALTKDRTIMATKALAMVHGTNNNAALNSTFIIRKTSGGLQQNIPVLLGKILKAQAPDVPLEADDILYVPYSHGKAAAKAGAQAALSLVTGLSIIAVSRN
jgi:polysaccharide export outer membrane protein